jgi:hypothetical protein
MSRLSSLPALYLFVDALNALDNGAQLTRFYAGRPNLIEHAASPS